MMMMMMMINRLPILRISHKSTHLSCLGLDSRLLCLYGDGAFRKYSGAESAGGACVPDVDKIVGGGEQSGGGGGNVKGGSRFAGKERKTYSQGSVNFEETAKFSAIAETWWDPNGPYGTLHLINPTRLSFIRSALCRHFRRSPCSGKPLDGLTIVDVGCGGGLLCEPIARMGGHVTGIDVVERNIQVATAHAARDPSTSSIQYNCTTAEQLVQDDQKFDVVIALEVIEHVVDPKEFVKILSALMRSGGVLIISTINRSIRGYLLAIVAAEYILQWLPRGTHQWSKFITPDELSLLMNHAGLSLQEMAGMVYNPLTKKWSLSTDRSVNYIAFGIQSS
eukprot:c24578_g1_i2 orf=1-1008(+)